MTDELITDERICRIEIYEVIYLLPINFIFDIWFKKVFHMKEIVTPCTEALIIFLWL